MEARFVDSHCHLNFSDFQHDVNQVIQSAEQKGVHTLVTICTKMEEAEQLQQIAKNNSSVFATVGIHPHEAATTYEHFSLSELEIWLNKHTSHDKVIGIGETGLDFYYEHSPRDIQSEVFKSHIRISVDTKLPISVHTRGADQETIEILKNYPRATGVIHCFSGSQYLADQALELGFYLSISGIATFKKSEELRQIIRTIPLDRLLLETDAPYLAPLPYRGRRNEPAFMIHTAQCVADLKGISLEELAEVTTYNFFTLFTKASSDKPV